MEGRTIKNLLYIIKNLGEGHTGDVFKARLTKDTDYGLKNGEIAIKRYKDWIVSESNQASRIDSELQTSIKINSENVVKSYELIEFENCLFLVMEYLSGQTLSKWLENEKRLPFDKIIQICMQILSGLKEIHKADLIHRDLKPDNLMMTKDRIVIMDLGVVKDFTASTSITCNKFLGTIKYAAPEYLFEEDYDQSIDLFSFGLILYELVFDEPLMKTTFWTKNIVEHYFYQFSGPDDYIRFFDKFPDRFQENEKKFLWILLNCLLENKSNRIGLKDILDSIENERWKNVNNWNIKNTNKVRYQRVELILSNFIAIKEIENLIGKPIPLYSEYSESNENGFRFNFQSHNGYVVSLALSGGKLEILPESFGELTKLQNLSFAGNRIRKLPESFSNLESLSFLNMLGNRLEDLSEDFKNLSNLQTLSTDVHYQKTFPSVIVELPSLKDLYIFDYKKTTILPDSFIKLRSLEKLVIQAEELELPDNFGKLKSLKTLSISGIIKNEKIPNSFWELDNLEELDLSSIKNLTTLPEEIKSLRHLETLKVNNCPLESIPKEIGALKNLKLFEFHDTKITELPKELLQLKHLKNIYAPFQSGILSEIAKKLEERGVKVEVFRISSFKNK